MRGTLTMATYAYTKLRKSPTRRHKGIVIVVIISSNALKPIAPLQAGCKAYSDNERTVLRCNLNKRDYVFKSFLNISISIELKL
uniref:Uncharacterized protein n=1 Tax=Glossina palpalis gambiensis TaxID=67801 RepID=A0A1B0ATD4_9MUSC